MATVTMDLTEIEALKKSVEAANAATQAEAKKLADLNGELIQVKADKRVVSITKTKYATHDNYGLRERLMRIIKSDFYSHNNTNRTLEDIHRELCGPSWDNNSIKPQIEAETVEFLNFEDVKQKLRDDVESQFKTELNALKNDKANYQENISKMQSKCDASLNTIHEKFDKDRDKYKKEIQELTQLVEDIKNDKDMRTTENKLKDEIAELKEQLEKARNKKWYQRNN